MLIDNLMTAIDMNATKANSDKFERQENFVKALVRMTVKYNIVTILVAHNKKGISGDANDDISGASEITNLAGAVFGYGRKKYSSDVQKEIDEAVARGDSVPEENERYLKVSKNRANGRITTGDGILMQYDLQSKRIYIDESDECNMDALCFAGEEGFVTYEEIPDMIPF